MKPDLKKRFGWSVAAIFALVWLLTFSAMAKDGLILYIILAFIALFLIYKFHS